MFKINYIPNTKLLDFRRVLIVFTFSFLLFSSCNSEPEYFKFTFTNENDPKGLLPDFFEINSNGKIIVSTDQFNENEELYNRTYFIELSAEQLDTALYLINAIENINYHYADSQARYLCRYDKILNTHRTSQMKAFESDEETVIELEEFCTRLLRNNKRHKLDHSYYFSTDEFCMRALKN